MPLDGRIQDFVPAEVDEVGEVLLKAAQIVRERWHQGSLGSCGHRVCAFGAIHEVSGRGHDDWERPFNALGGRAADRLRSFIGRDVPAWNDIPQRTSREVAAAMIAAARMKD